MTVADDIWRRPPTPGFLRRFVRDLYGGRCLRCGLDRPLAVAHLASWPVVRADVKKNPGPDPAGTAFWRFHQPANVVLLCCNCHALFDDPKMTEVDQQLLFFLRDRAMSSPMFGSVVRRFVCHEMGPVLRHPVSMNGLTPLLEWLQAAAVAGTLPPPYRFVVPWGSQFWHADLVAAEWRLEDEPDSSLPCWDGSGLAGGIEGTA